MIRKISVIIILIIILMSLIPIKSNAQVPINSAYIYATKETEALLMWNGLNIYTHMAVYKKDGKEYPAYCMNRDLSGVEIGFSQTVDVSNVISNVMVWRAIINGYPYKSISELGCQTEEEAYLATKQAVYCMLTNRNVNEYSPIGESGKRTLNALKQIVTNARNSGVTKVSSDLTINQENSLWKIDSIDKNYMSQTYSVSANASFDCYTVNLSDLNLEGAKTTDENNNEKSKFSSNEKFKILIPITNVISEGSFTINVSGSVATKPVWYGKSRDTSLQNYALTGYTFEDGIGNKKINYIKNETKIIVNKKDETGENSIKGVKFELLDENKNTIYTDLTTDNNGQIQIENLLPGVYYLKETRTLEGYELYDKLIKIEVDLNEEAKVNVINSKEEVNIEKNKSNTENTVKTSKSETQVKLPKTGM